MVVARPYSALNAIGTVLGLAVFTACSSGVVSGPSGGETKVGTPGNGTPGNNTPNPSMDTPSGTAPSTSGNPSTMTQVEGGPPTISSGPPPTITCGGAPVPATVMTLCTGCHTANGAANARYPDLFNFKGDVNAFLAQVRKGGGPMAAYPAGLISDADVQAAFTYFTTNKRGVNPIQLGGVTPLFSASDAVNPPIVFKRADGVLVTRGAGRVRGRHEKEGSFGPFLDNYFDDRTYGWIIEDWTPTGTKQIRVTYLPLKMVDHNGNRITNWRSWKVPGNNATFMSNKYAVDAMPTDIPMTPTGPFAFQQQYTETPAVMPAARTMDVGQNYEFEIGIFISPNALTTPGSRDSYYTDCFRYQIGIGGLTPNNTDYAAAPGPVPSARLGGDTTIAWLFAEPYMYFDEFALNIQHENVQNFVMGRRLFHTDFVTGQHSETGNPTFTAQAGKSGPLAQTQSCVTCHLNNGPGQLITTALDSKSSMVFKLAGSALGGQLRPQQGSASVMGTTSKTVTLGDGTAVVLSKPNFSVTSSMGDASHFSARLARKLIGLGLLEAVDEQTILTRADPTDCNQDGIAGRPNYVKDPANGALRIGRIGWKAEKVGIAHQVADAANLDLDVGSALIPNSQGKAGLSSDEFNRLVTYMRLVGVPPQLNATDPQVMAGEQVFKTTGCSNCHVTDVVTGGNHPFSELRNQSIRPFTDLLLHDMGPDLADNSGVPVDRTNPAAPPGASEWRTPPLWGLGKYKIVNAHTNLLHDGRAVNPLEAVLWHGGEAEKVKKNFIALSAADRTALLAFLDSL
jgi:CxxC motif-containing protein (DUF1111 family)